VKTSSSSTVYSHTLQQFSYVQGAAVAAATPSPIIMSLTANASLANYQPLTGFCGLGSTNPCVCELVWTQANTVNNASYRYQRTKRVSVTEVQAGLVKCSIDYQTWSEIPDASVIQFRIVPGTTNTTGLNTTTLSWKKGTSLSAAGDFLDDTLTPFRNIQRYTCFSKSLRAHEIVNNYSDTSSSDPSVQPVHVIMGSQYCVAGSASNGGAACPQPRNGSSAQSYYRNFYIRSDQLGTINSTNDTYDCPKVLESIKYSAGPGIPTTENGKYFPLDTTFALATSNSPDWSVGVPAATNLFKLNDVNSVQTACSDEPTDLHNRLKDGKVVVKCLGYARKPNVNGTCGTIKDSNGRLRPLTRLRKFRVVYPPMFDSTGKIVAGNAAADEVYVADRLVVDNTGTATGNMIYGPKPCNFAWFDHEGVTTRDGAVNFYSNLRGDFRSLAAAQGYATPGYVATSSYQYFENRSNSLEPNYGLHQWSVDPDGLVLPNVDRAGSISNAQNYASCSVTLPWVDWLNGTPQDVRLITTNANRADKISLGGRDLYLREIHNQPLDPWSPNYLEDTSFNACVPLPTTVVEPPLHFYQKDNNTMGWCAKVYPTQNPYWYDLNNFRKPQFGSASLTANDATVTAGNAPGSQYGVAPLDRAPVLNYTSHDRTVTNDLLDQDGLNANCMGTLGATLCPMTGFLAGSTAACVNYLTRTGHPIPQSVNTCDRTVMFDSNQQYLDFPLLARDAEIEKMLKEDLNHDRGYSCQYSVNADPSKIGAKIPSTGCCGIGGAVPHKLLRNLINGTGGHLEPYLDPAATDDIRFCGWPVE
jgi:hypothetical protein